MKRASIIKMRKQDNFKNKKQFTKNENKREIKREFKREFKQEFKRDKRANQEQNDDEKLILKGRHEVVQALENGQT